ncbi:MAG: DUF4232 domain-containing protein [Actinobacteria bacterium]|uniref:Unannotated protein n=1 Tax=freshwater metagenome TaxID=449393 RepID=A0A6J6PCU6_9ZZZZ|nr:DUF4232 domain-containing protein [Actinomycetota bacterium]
MSSTRITRFAVALVASAAVTMLGAPAGADASDVRACTNADLSASYHATDAAMSHRYGRIVLTNTSDSACSTGGYGGLSYVGHGDGTQVGAAAERDPSTVRTLVVQPGARVVSRVSETEAGVYPKKACHPTKVDGFRVYVPNSTESQFVAHPTTGCSSSSVELLSHRALRRP